MVPFAKSEPESYYSLIYSFYQFLLKLIADLLENDGRNSNHFV